jgi:hypothetical protein
MIELLVLINDAKQPISWGASEAIADVILRCEFLASLEGWPHALR